MSSLTRGNIIDRVAAILGDTSTSFRTYLETSVNHTLHALWDFHDWEWKHKVDTFTTVAGTESYDLSSVTTNKDIRSAQDIEVLYNKTEGGFLNKVDLKDIRKNTPKEDSSGKPVVYAPWGTKTIFLHDEPDAAYVMKMLYLAKCTTPTADTDNLESVCGLPDYVQYLFEKMVLAEGMLFFDDNRRTAMLNEIATIWLPKAIQADMKHLESGARFKFWEEELTTQSQSYDDFLRRTWANADNY